MRLLSKALLIQNATEFLEAGCSPGGSNVLSMGTAFLLYFFRLVLMWRHPCSVLKGKYPTYHILRGCCETKKNWCEGHLKVKNPCI